MSRNQTAVDRVLANGLANGEADIVDALRELHDRLTAVETPTGKTAKKATSARSESPE